MKAATATVTTTTTTTTKARQRIIERVIKVGCGRFHDSALSTGLASATDRLGGRAGQDHVVVVNIIISVAGRRVRTSSSNSNSSTAGAIRAERHGSQGIEWNGMEESALEVYCCCCCFAFLLWRKQWSSDGRGKGKRVDGEKN